VVLIIHFILRGASKSLQKKSYFCSWFNISINRIYILGITPNPDILCNREIKFKVLVDKALSIGGMDRLHIE
jgi:tRNA U34 2-thiouridine synthase MnmA/TrmU